MNLSTFFISFFKPLPKYHDIGFRTFFYLTSSFLNLFKCRILSCIQRKMLIPRYGFCVFQLTAPPLIHGMRHGTTPCSNFSMILILLCFLVFCFFPLPEEAKLVPKGDYFSPLTWRTKNTYRQLVKGAFGKSFCCCVAFLSKNFFRP